MRRMNGSRQLGVFGLLAVCCAAQGATLREALEAVPRDTIAMVCVPSLSGLEAELLAATKRSALDGMLPALAGSPMALLRGALPFGDGLDPDGAMVGGVLNPSAIGELRQRGFVLIPAKNPKEFIEGMDGRSGSGEGLWSVRFHGSPYFAAIRGTHVVIAEGEETAKAAAADPGKSLGDVLSREDLRSFERQDIFVWVKLEEALKLVKPQIDMFTSMSLLAQAAKGPAGMKQAEASKKQIDMLLHGLSTWIVGLAIEDRGIGLRIAVRARPGSEMDQSTRRPQTGEPLLRSLPVENYLLAGGSRSSPEMLKREIETNLRPFLAVGEALPGIDKPKYAEFARLVEEWAGSMRAIRFAIVDVAHGEPPGDGLLGVVGYVEAENARRWIELFGQGVESAKAVFAPDTVDADPGLKTLLSAAAWNAKTEDIGGTTVARLVFDFSKSEWRGGAESPPVRAILGGDGLCIRVAMVDEKMAVLTIGGGPRLMERGIASGRKTGSPIEENAGVKRTASALPPEREGVVYFAVDRMVNMGPRIVRLFDDTGMSELKLPAIETPVGISSSGAEHVGRVDIFVPDDVIVGVKDAVLRARMGDGKAGSEPGTNSDARPGDAGTKRP